MQALDQARLALEALGHEGVECDTLMAALATFDDGLHDAAEQVIYQTGVAAVELSADLRYRLALRIGTVEHRTVLESQLLLQLFDGRLDLVFNRRLQDFLSLIKLRPFRDD